MFMARALRVEYEGARYHVMCRGNHSQTIFHSQEDADLFTKTLGEMCSRNQTVVHAWCLMSNHYHLLLETPAGNLVSAMKWLQATFTQRYNARHKLWGHLFQGRYKAKVIDDEDGRYFRAVGDYIHLNPAEAGLIKPGELSKWPWSSFVQYISPPSERPKWLRAEDLLGACGIPRDTPAGRLAFSEYMTLRQRSLLRAKAGSPERSEWERMERGWIHGNQSFRDRMLECLRDADPEALRHAHDLNQRRELGESSALKVVERCLKVLGLSSGDLLSMKKGDERKQIIAGYIRYHYPVSAAWVADVLQMGHYTTVSRAMRFYDHPGAEWDVFKQEILKITG